MKRRTFVEGAVPFFGAMVLKPSQLLFSQDSLPRVLIIGDSISIGYTDAVRELLKGIAVVNRPMNEGGKPENCQGTTYGLESIDDWLGDGDWDIIHFNFGLHDLKSIDPKTGKSSENPRHPPQAKLKKYRRQLEKIVDRLKATKAYLIFATTTPYPDPVEGPYRAPGLAEKYNKVALKIMSEHGIKVNDLYGFTKPRMAELLRPQNVHFTEDGSRILAEEVASQMKKVLLRNP